MKTSKVLSSIDKAVLRQLTRKSDLWAAWLFIFNYVLIAGSFVLVALYPSFLSVLAALIILGGRQLGLAILMHDASHGALFKTKWMNQFFGQYLGAVPILADIDRYREYHLTHHWKAGTDQDPDRSNYINYPVKPASMFRKFFRDLTGITGVKTLVLLYKMNSGSIAYQLSYEQVELKNQKKKGPVIALKNLWPALLFQLALFVLCYTFGEPLLYLLWPLAWLTTYMFFSRIRNAAEHAATPDVYAADVLQNTRTTRAAWWERLCFAPNYVNYHLEHHLLPTVPGYRLKTFHLELKKAGLLDKADIRSGYYEVIQHLMAP